MAEVMAEDVVSDMNEKRMSLGFVLFYLADLSFIVCGTSRAPSPTFV